MDKKVKIIHEDSSLLVVDKPAGLVVNRSNTTKDFTLQDYVDESHVEEEDLLSDPENIDEFTSRSGIVHRLDKDTSGVIVIAKTPEVFANLQAQFKNRLVKKEYLALVNGAFKYEKVEVDAPIKRHPDNFAKFAVVAGGRDAFTVFEREKIIEKDAFSFSLVKCFPRTGRTHQIRVHLTALGHPVVSDPIYCTRNVLGTNSLYFHRLMLHARKIGFNHPETGTLCEYLSEIPSEFVL